MTLEAPVLTGDPRLLVLPRYKRSGEKAATFEPNGQLIPYEHTDNAIEAAEMTPGSRQLLRGLLAHGRTAVFPGGEVGIDYAILLKQDTLPLDLVGDHAAEAGAYLREQGTNLLVIPGNSGVKIGREYAAHAGLQPVVFDKLNPDDEPDREFAHGAFVIPSYTGGTDVVMNPPLDAVREVLEPVLLDQLGQQKDVTVPVLTVAIGFADDIIDKAAMADAMYIQTRAVGHRVMGDILIDYRRSSGDPRPISPYIRPAGVATPFHKAYNASEDDLARRFGVRPFTGVSISSVHPPQNAIGVTGVGILQFRS